LPYFSVRHTVFVLLVCWGFVAGYVKRVRYAYALAYSAAYAAAGAVNIQAAFIKYNGL
jgi:hypothetical protein